MSDDPATRDALESRSIARRHLRLTSGAVILMGIVLGWLLYSYIWGFGGLYTINYLPRPENLISASIAAPAGDFSTARRNAVYRVQQPLDAVVAFYQRTLPEAGWTILDQGILPTSVDADFYCIVTVQRGLRADILLVGRGQAPLTGITIHFDDPGHCGSRFR